MCDFSFHKERLFVSLILHGNGDVLNEELEEMLKIAPRDRHKRFSDYGKSI